MKDHITVHKSGQTQLGQDSLAEGYVGKVARLANFHTQTLVRPGATLADIKFSIETIQHDIEARIAELGEDAEF